MSTRPLRWLEYSKRSLINNGVFINLFRQFFINLLVVHLFISVENACCPIHWLANFVICYSICHNVHLDKIKLDV